MSMKDKYSEQPTIAELVRLAGPRTAVPEEAMHRSRVAVKAAWRETVDDGRRQRRHRWLLAAAAVLLISVLFLSPELRSLLWGPQPVLATVEVWTGSGLHGAFDASGPRAGDRIATRDGRAALRLSGGASLRLDTQTEVDLPAEHRLDLVQGAIYVDSGPRDAQVTIETPFGTVRDIGTQFEVRVQPDGLRVRVREGEVEIRQGRRLTRVGEGIELRFDKEGQPQQQKISSFGDPWRPYQAVAPPFQLEGAALSDYLLWLTRETGWAVDYSDPTIPLEAPTVILHGSIQRIPVQETPQMVLPTCRLQSSLHHGVLKIRRMSEVSP